MNYRFYLKALIIIVVCCAGFVFGQDKPKIQTKNQNTSGKEFTLLVTAYPHNDKQRAIAAKLQNSDFAVLEDKRTQKIISVKNAAELPINVAIVVQDNLDWRVNSEIKGLKDFIQGLPQGSRVMTAYLTNGGAIVTQELTTDRRQAAETLRIIRGVSFPPTFSPYDGVQTVLQHFEDKTIGRKMVLVVSDGLDMSLGYNYASPYFSISLDKAIKEAQRRGISIFTIYAPSEDRRIYGRFAVNYGQGSLIRLADETGGESYIGLDLVNFSSFLQEFKEAVPYQWLITYHSSTVGNQFRRIEVTTDFDVHLHHPAGYEPLKAK
jgi:VWFA-related protein